MYSFVSIGSDPEFIIVDKKDNIIPAFLFTNGTKDNPEDMGGGYFLSYDNVTLEGNIPPAYNKRDFLNNMNTLKEIIKERISIRNGSISYKDFIEIPDRVKRNPIAMEAGCDPDLDIYYSIQKKVVKKSIENETLAYGEPSFNILIDGNPARTNKIRNSMQGNLRFAGFHIHIGISLGENEYPSTSFEDDGFIQTIKAVDKALFPLYAKYYNGVNKRNDFYAHSKEQGGIFRVTPYGFEYRSLGSFFTQDKYLPIIYDKIEKAFEKNSMIDKFSPYVNRQKIKVK